MPGGKGLEDFISAMRYGSGRQFPVTNPITAGKAGGAFGAEQARDTTEEMNAPDRETKLDMLLKILGATL